MRLRNKCPRTEQADVGCIRRFIPDHDLRYPDDMRSTEVVDFLAHLAVEGGVAASTPSQAAPATPCFYKEVLGRDLIGLDGAVRVRAPR